MMGYIFLTFHLSLTEYLFEVAFVRHESYTLTWFELLSKVLNMYIFGNTVQHNMKLRKPCSGINDF